MNGEKNFKSLYFKKRGETPAAAKSKAISEESLADSRALRCSLSSRCKNQCARLSLSFSRVLKFYEKRDNLKILPFRKPFKSKNACAASFERGAHFFQILKKESEGEKEREREGRRRRR